MNKIYEKMSKEISESIRKAISTKEISEFITKTETSTSEDSGSFKVIVSTDEVDRQGEVVNQEGWDLTWYKTNPVVLWAHKYDQLPIGVCTSIEVVNGKLVAEGKFAPSEANPFAQNVRKLYELGMLNTVSVGFMPTAMDASDKNKTSTQEMLEFSFVPVPANREALRLSISQVKDLGLDVPIMMTKGLRFDISEKAPEAGSRCEMDDGTPGVLADDPKNPGGPMVCVPEKTADKAPATPGDDGDAIKTIKEAVKVYHKAVKDSHGVHLEALEGHLKVLKDAMKDMGDGDDVGDTPTADSKSVEVKGEISAELDAIEKNQVKWQNLHEICEAMDAMFSVYMDEATPVEDFEKLATELSQIIAGIAKNPDDGDADNKVITKMLGDKKSMHFTLKDHMPIVKEAMACLDAAMKAHKNAQNIHKDTMEHIKNAHSALGGVKPSDGSGADEGADGDADGKSAAQRSIASKDSGIKEMNDFLESRDFLRMVVNSGSKALEHMNIKAREYAARK